MFSWNKCDLCLRPSQNDWYNTEDSSLPLLKQAFKTNQEECLQIANIFGKLFSIITSGTNCRRQVANLCRQCHYFSFKLLWLQYRKHWRFSWVSFSQDEHFQRNQIYEGKVRMRCTQLYYSLKQFVMQSLSAVLRKCKPRAWSPYSRNNRRTCLWSCSEKGFNPILPGAGRGGKIRPLLFFLHHPKTAQAIKLKLSDF